MLTSRELSEWEAYDKIDPIGEMRMDMRFAQLQATITNIAIAQGTPEGQTPKLTDALDFMTDYTGDIEQAKEKRDVDRMKSAVLGWVNSIKKGD